jgi:hypothetical protein
VKRSVVEYALIRNFPRTIAANVEIPAGQVNTVAGAAVYVQQEISSATAHALIVPSTTTTVANAEMFVLRAQPAPQMVAFPIRDKHQHLE